MWEGVGSCWAPGNEEPSRVSPQGAESSWPNGRRQFLLEPGALEETEVV